MFEDRTYENILHEALENAPSDIDKRQGSIFYDAVSGVILKIAKLYTDLDLITGMTTVSTAVGEALDIKAAEYGVERLVATNAKYYALFEGKTPDTGERFFHDGKYFVLHSRVGILYFEAEISGESQNNIIPGTAAVPVDNIDGLISSAFGSLYESGSDSESDESLRTRIMEKIAGPAENGNRQHYKTWCESIDGIGKARIFPLWNGENTVKAVLIDTTGKPLGSAKVQEVQNFIDPADKGLTAVVDGKTYTVGDGMGNGRANIGAHFTAVSAEPLNITVTFKAELAAGYTAETAEIEAYSKIESYLKELVLSANENTEIVIRISAIGAILSSLESIYDYSNLKLNGNTGNITVGSDFVPVLLSVNAV